MVLTLGVLLSVVLVPVAQAAPAPPCTYPVQCNADGSVRLGFSEVSPAAVVDWWVPGNAGSSHGQYVQFGGTQLFESVRLVAVGSDGFAHYQGVFPSSEVFSDGYEPIQDDSTTEVRINYSTPGQPVTATYFTVRTIAPAVGFECTTSGKKSITAQCTLEARRAGLTAQLTLALYSQKKGGPWKPKQTVNASQAFSSTGTQSGQTAPLKVKCKPGRKYRVSASGELFTEADGQLWNFDSDQSEPQRVKCKKP